MKIWPFLITRNKSLGYQLVVAPDFLVDAKTASVLLYVTEGELSAEVEAYSRQIEDAQIGKTTTIVYRVTQAMDESGLLLKDGYGRHITQTIGIVLPEQISSNTVPRQIFDEVLPLIQKPLRQFWQAETTFPMAKAPAIEWSVNLASTPSYKLIDLGTYQVAPSKSNQQSPSQPNGKVEDDQSDDSSQNLLIRLFMLLRNWFNK